MVWAVPIWKAGRGIGEVGALEVGERIGRMGERIGMGEVARRMGRTGRRTGVGMEEVAGGVAGNEVAGFAREQKVLKKGRKKGRKEGRKEGRKKGKKG